MRRRGLYRWQEQAGCTKRKETSSSIYTILPLFVSLTKNHRFLKRAELNMCFTFQSVRSDLRVDWPRSMGRKHHWMQFVFKSDLFGEVIEIWNNCCGSLEGMVGLLSLLLPLLLVQVLKPLHSLLLGSLPLILTLPILVFHLSWHFILTLPILVFRRHGARERRCLGGEGRSLVHFSMESTSRWCAGLPQKIFFSSKKLGIHDF